MKSSFSKFQDFQDFRLPIFIFILSLYVLSSRHYIIMQDYCVISISLRVGPLPILVTFYLFYILFYLHVSHRRAAVI